MREKISSLRKKAVCSLVAVLLSGCGGPATSTSSSWGEKDASDAADNATWAEKIAPPNPQGPEGAGLGEGDFAPLVNAKQPAEGEESEDDGGTDGGDEKTENDKDDEVEQEGDSVTLLGQPYENDENVAFTSTGSGSTGGHESDGGEGDQTQTGEDPCYGGMWRTFAGFDRENVEKTKLCYNAHPSKSEAMTGTLVMLLFESYSKEVTKILLGLLDQTTAIYLSEQNVRSDVSMLLNDLKTEGMAGGRFLFQVLQEQGRNPKNFLSMLYKKALKGHAAGAAFLLDYVISEGFGEELKQEARRLRGGVNAACSLVYFINRTAGGLENLAQNCFGLKKDAAETEDLLKLIILMNEKKYIEAGLELLFYYKSLSLSDDALNVIGQLFRDLDSNDPNRAVWRGNFIEQFEWHTAEGTRTSAHFLNRLFHMGARSDPESANRLLAFVEKGEFSGALKQEARRLRRIPNLAFVICNLDIVNRAVRRYNRQIPAELRSILRPRRQGPLGPVGAAFRDHYNLSLEQGRTAFANIQNKSLLTENGHVEEIDQYLIMLPSQWSLWGNEQQQKLSFEILKEIYKSESLLNATVQRFNFLSRHYRESGFNYGRTDRLEQFFEIVKNQTALDLGKKTWSNLFDCLFNNLMQNAAETETEEQTRQRLKMWKEKIVPFLQKHWASIPQEQRDFLTQVSNDQTRHVIVREAANAIPAL